MPAYWQAVKWQSGKLVRSTTQSLLAPCSRHRTETAEIIYSLAPVPNIKHYSSLNQLFTAGKESSSPIPAPPATLPGRHNRRELTASSQGSRSRLMKPRSTSWPASWYSFAVQLGLLELSGQYSIQLPPNHSFYACCCIWGADVTQTVRLQRQHQSHSKQSGSALFHL